MAKIAIYPGSFDPITNGHLDIMKRIKFLFDKVVIAVNDNPLGPFLFTASERVVMIRVVLSDFPGLEVEKFRGLLVSDAETKRARTIVRGLSGVTDCVHE